MQITERRTLFQYLLSLSCAFSDDEKSILLDRYMILPQYEQAELIEILSVENRSYAQIFA